MALSLENFSGELDGNGLTIREISGARYLIDCQEL